MAEAVELEVLNGRRCWATAQALLAGEKRDAQPVEMDVGWHDTSVHPESGAFAVVGIDAGLGDWIGEVLQVTGNGRAVFVYVLGSADVPTGLSLSRRAFASLSALAAESLLALVDVIA